MFNEPITKVGEIDITPSPQAYAAFVTVFCENILESTYNTKKEEVKKQLGSIIDICRHLGSFAEGELLQDLIVKYQEDN